METVFQGGKYSKRECSHSAKVQRNKNTIFRFSEEYSKEKVSDRQLLYFNLEINYERTFFVVIQSFKFTYSIIVRLRKYACKVHLKYESSRDLHRN